MSLYGEYDNFFQRFPDLVGTRRGGKNRAATARRVHGKFAPNNPEKPFEVDMDSHRRGGVVGGRKRKVAIEVLGLRDPKTGRIISEKELDNGTDHR